MTTTALPGGNLYDTSVDKSPTATRVRVGRSGIGTVGVLTVLISAWGVLIPFVGPAFGYRGNGEPSWHWSNAHLFLALVPGVVGFLMGLVILQGTSRVSVGRGRISLAVAGLIAMLCGAWFIIGPLAWPVVTNNGAYFAPAAPLRSLAYQVGYGLGTGLILAVCGGYVMGWASRHQKSGVATAPAGATAPAPQPLATAAPPAAPAATAPAPQPLATSAPPAAPPVQETGMASAPSAPPPETPEPMA
jgi:hypothetical protein